VSCAKCSARRARERKQFEIFFAIEIWQAIYMKEKDKRMRASYCANINRYLLTRQRQRLPIFCHQYTFEEDISINNRTNKTTMRFHSAVTTVSAAAAAAAALFSTTAIIPRAEAFVPFDCFKQPQCRKSIRRHSIKSRLFAANSKTRSFSSSSKTRKSSKRKPATSEEGDDDNDDDGDDDEAIAVFQAPSVDPALLPFASTYHAPVMWKECIEGMLSGKRTQQNEKSPLIFVDGTLGGGGHSEALLQALKPGDVLFGCDVDPAALKVATERLSSYLQPSDDKPLFVPVQSNFAQLATRLPQQLYPFSDSNAAPQKIMPSSLHAVDGILLDLGVSSHQIDTAERGFAFMKDGPLDMRMMAGKGNDSSTEQPDSSLTAADLCNEMEEAELARMFMKYGDEPRNRARNIAQSIVNHRPLKTTGDLQQAVAAVVPAFNRQSKRKGLTATLARIFQSLRIVVNQEDRVLEEVLEDVCPNLLREGGRLVILSYHSMEDRATKRVMRDGTIQKQRGSPEKDIYGNSIGPAKPFRPVGKFQKATDEEIASNSRARSATLRIAERLPIAAEDDSDHDD